MPAGKLAPIAGVLAVYILLALGNLLTLRPWCDESWFSSPALNLITRGDMGTSVLDPTTSWRSVRLTGIDRYTYWIMPLYPLTEAAWYEVTGFGLFATRTLSVLWGVVALAAWYLIMMSLSGDGFVSLLTILLMAIDFQFLWSASAGRMDMMAAALSFAGLASYLRLRERRFPLALFAGNSLIAAAVFTHPVAIMALAALIVLTLYYDRASIRWRHLPWAATPYLLGAAGWGVYIMKNPTLFRTQFGGNAGDRWAVFSAPITALKLEIADRYLATYGLASYTSGASRLKIVIALLYAWGIAACLATPAIRRHKGYRALLIVTAIYFVSLPLIDGFKQVFYLVHIIPMFTALLAVWIASNFKRWTARAVLVCLIGVQLAVTGYRIKQDPYKNSYLEAAQFLRTKDTNGAIVMGSAEWAFQLGFNGHLVDDFRLGFRSGKKADLIIMDEGRYEPWIANLAQQDPDNYRYIQHMLADDFRLVRPEGYYKMYARVQ